MFADIDLLRAHLTGMALQLGLDRLGHYVGGGKGGKHRAKRAFKKGNHSSNNPHQGKQEIARRLGVDKWDVPARRWHLMIGDMVICPELASTHKGGLQRLVNHSRKPNQHRLVLL